MEQCKEAGCNEPVQVKKRGLCRRHYNNWCQRTKPAGRKCGLADCDNGHYSKGLCHNHYEANRRNGAPVLQKELHSNCVECGTEIGFKADKCRTCYARVWVRRVAGTRDIAAYGEPTTYAMAHQRLVKVRGFASTYECSLCDKRAEQWALSAATQDLRFGSVSGRKKLSAFSTDPYMYFPACRDCHCAYDAAHSNKNFRSRPSRWAVTA